MDPFLNTVVVNIKEGKRGGPGSLHAEAGEQGARAEAHGWGSERQIQTSQFRFLVWCGHHGQPRIAGLVPTWLHSWLSIISTTTTKLCCLGQVAWFIPTAQTSLVRFNPVYTPECFTGPPESTRASVNSFLLFPRSALSVFSGLVQWHQHVPRPLGQIPRSRSYPWWPPVWVRFTWLGRVCPLSLSSLQGWGPSQTGEGAFLLFPGGQSHTRVSREKCPFCTFGGKIFYNDFVR